MKQFILLLTLFTCFACKQNASPIKQDEAASPTKPAADSTGSDNDRPLSMVSSITIEAGGAVVPNPIKTLYTFRNSHPEGDLHQVFFDYKESDNTKTMYEGTFALRMDDNQKAYELLEKVAATENGKKFEPKGPPCVGSRGRTYAMAYFDGKKANFEVTGGAMCETANLPPPIKDLNALGDALAQELKAQTAMRLYKRIVGKTWQLISDPKTTVIFADGLMTETVKGEKQPPVFFRFSDNCKTAKDRSEGMSAGNLGCISTWAQDEVEYMITDLDDKTLEFKQMGTDKMQTYTLAKTVTHQGKITANGIVINAKGDDFFFGTKFDVRKLPELLDAKLATMETIPDDIPVYFNGETGMGLRGEVRTEIKEAIDKAKANKAKH
jgi:hypothetical protein